MKSEHSAGGIIAYKARTGWWILLMKDMAGIWTFPKGMVEAGESDESAAIREIREEVGIGNLTALAKLPTVSYLYTRGSRRTKTVSYFLFRAKRKEAPVVQVSEGISDAQWVPLARAIQIVGYPQTNMQLLEQVSVVLHSREGARR